MRAFFKINDIVRSQQELDQGMGRYILYSCTDLFYKTAVVVSYLLSLSACSLIDMPPIQSKQRSEGNPALCRANWIKQLVLKMDYPLLQYLTHHLPLEPCRNVIVRRMSDSPTLSVYIHETLN